MQDVGAKSCAGDAVRSWGTESGSETETRAGVRRVRGTETCMETRIVDVDIERCKLKRFHARKPRAKEHVERLTKRIQANGFEQAQAVWGAADDDNCDMFLPTIQQIARPLLLELACDQDNWNDPEDFSIIPARGVPLVCRIRRHGHFEQQDDGESGESEGGAGSSADSSPDSCGCESCLRRRQMQAGRRASETVN